MTKENKISNWVTEWYDWLLGEISRNIAKDSMSMYAEDLLHHLIIDLYNLPEHKVNQMVEDDKLRWYVLRGAGMQLRSSTSPFYLTWRKHKMYARENYSDGGGEHDNHIGMGILDKVYEPYEKPEYEVCFDEVYENLHFYQKALIEKKFIQGWTFEEMYKHYNISKRHLIKDINETLILIKSKCS